MLLLGLGRHRSDLHTCQSPGWMLGAIQVNGVGPALVCSSLDTSAGEPILGTWCLSFPLRRAASSLVLAGRALREAALPMPHAWREVKSHPLCDLLWVISR